MHEVEWLEFDDRAAMVWQVVNDVEIAVECAVDARGCALLAVPGGKTPVPIFRALAARSLNWPKVMLLPTDERLVAEDDPLSNAGLIRAHFGTTGATIMPLCERVDIDPGAAGRAADRRLRVLQWPFDLVWLGMGEDGHTASILPGPDFEAALSAPLSRRACGVVPDPPPKEAPVARVTLTRAALVATRTLMLTISGDKKRAVARQAIEDGPRSATAIGRVLAECSAPIKVVWCK
ncbi:MULTISPECIES: 6-phosphogluconolactonase [Sphingomonadaceae]|jgi:6-phosphogluconolactonase|uniref:6-phosphogluconolactonase n=1 Tax=Sphingomonadales TaxID=204457 RepID=UPI0022ED87BF|nr:6-phosphogluconolactonase [Sphingobium sp. BS19]GLI98855.1 6-phosphogluconolactonase [Sphingobium sp. BS19]